MGTPDIASSGVVRPSRSLAARVFLLACVLLTFAGLVASVGACKRKPDAAAEASPEPPVVRDMTDGLQLTWIDEKGEFHVEQRVADVPPGSRDVVRVRALDPTADTPSGDRVFVVDLRTAAADGTYGVRTVPRTEFEDVAVARRTKNGSAVLAPKAAPSAPPAASGGVAGDVAGRPAVIIYGASWCGPCHQAAAYLKQKGVAFVEHDIEQDSSKQREMQAKLAKAGMRGGSIPVLDVRGRILVGFDARAVEQALGL
jgi:glutaredoxin